MPMCGVKRVPCPRLRGHEVVAGILNMPTQAWAWHLVLGWLLVLALLCMPAWAEDAPPFLAEIGPKPKPVETPSAAEIERSIERGVAFLLARQNKDGSWGSANITRPEGRLRTGAGGASGVSRGRDGPVHFGLDRNRRQPRGRDQGPRSGRSLAVPEPVQSAPRYPRSSNSRLTGTSPPTHSIIYGHTPTAFRHW